MAVHTIHFNDRLSTLDRSDAHLSERKVAGQNTIQIRVRFNKKIDQEIKDFNDQNNALHMRKVDGQEIYLIYFRAADQPNFSNIIDNYASQTFISLVEPNLCYHVETGREHIYTVEPPSIAVSTTVNNTTTPLFNDEDYNLQWYFTNTGQYGGILGEDVKLEEAIRYINAKLEDQTISINHEVRLAILDDGLDPVHEDLNRTNVINGFDVIDGDSKPTPSGGLTHGTNVAGIIYATVNNGLGIVGINPNLKILIGRMISKNASTSTPSWAAQAIRVAVDNGAKIINMSWGLPNKSGEILEAILYAVDHDVLLVAAAGNYTDNSDNELLFPATENAVLSVGACDDSARRISLENCAADVKFGSRVGSELDLLAPGINIYTTKFDSKVRRKSYAIFNGTSAAAPIVSAVASLMLAIDPSLSSADLKRILKSTCDDIRMHNASQGEWQLGSGRLNALEAIKEVIKNI